MSRFYTDPRRAAIMSHDYVVKFLPLYPGANDDDNYKQLCLAAHNRNDYIKFYVHPDSEHIFQPQKNDFGEDAMGSPCLYNGEEWVNLAGRGHWITDPVAITRRNGNAFFMPEMEA